MNAWLTDTLERVASTAAEVALPSFLGSDIFHIDWRAALGLTASAAIVTVLKAVVAKFKGDPNTASFVAS